MNKKNKLILGIIVVFVIIVLGIILVVRYSSINQGGYNDFPQIGLACQIDADCVPTPGVCHPTTCVNTDTAAAIISYNKDIGNTACTMEFRMNAAYSPEDCICQELVCTNKNLNRLEQ